MQLAKEAQARFPAAQREISCLTMTMSRKCFEVIKQKIVDFKEEILADVLEDKDSDQVYQLNFQLFPLAEPRQPDQEENKS